MRFGIRAYEIEMIFRVREQTDWGGIDPFVYKPSVLSAVALPKKSVYYNSGAFLCLVFSGAILLYPFFSFSRNITEYTLTTRHGVIRQSAHNARRITHPSKSVVALLARVPSLVGVIYMPHLVGHILLGVGAKVFGATHA